jgi:hypothetical protein
VSTEDARSLAIIALIAVAPIVVVLLFAILRGYTVTLHMTREDRRPKRDE